MEPMVTTRSRVPRGPEVSGSRSEGATREPRGTLLRVVTVATHLTDLDPKCF